MFILYPSGHLSLRLSLSPSTVSGSGNVANGRYSSAPDATMANRLPFHSLLQLREDRFEQHPAERRGFGFEFCVGFSDSLPLLRFGQVFLRLARSQQFVDAARRRVYFGARRKFVAVDRISRDGPKPALLFAERVFEQHGVFIKNLLLYFLCGKRLWFG